VNFYLLHILVDNLGGKQVPNKLMVVDERIIKLAKILHKELCEGQGTCKTTLCKCYICRGHRLCVGTKTEVRKHHL